MYVSPKLWKSAKIFSIMFYLFTILSMEIPKQDLKIRNLDLEVFPLFPHIFAFFLNKSSYFFPSQPILHSFASPQGGGDEKYTTLREQNRKTVT